MASISLDLDTASFTQLAKTAVDYGDALDTWDKEYPNAPHPSNLLTYSTTDGEIDILQLNAFGNSLYFHHRASHTQPADA